MSKNFNAVEYIKQVINEYDDTIDTRPSTAFHDLFLKPMTYLVQQLLDDQTSISESQSIESIESLTVDDADAHIANLLISRITGNKSSGTVRFYFNEPVNITIPEGTVVLSSSGLRFLSVEDVTYTKQSMSLNKEGGYYYITVDFESEEAGSAYNVTALDIISLEADISNVVKVSNPSAFISGETTETNAQLKDRSEEAVTVRNLLSARSINTLLRQNFPAIKSILTVGYYEPEMNRDIITTEIDGTSFDIHIGGKVDIYTQTNSWADATADTTATTIIPASYYRGKSISGTTNSTSTFYDSSASFVSSLVQSGDILSIISGVGAGDYTVSSIIDSTSLTLVSPISSTDSYVAYEIKQESRDWTNPIVQISEVSRLDPSTLSPSGEYLYDGRSVVVDPKLIGASGSDPEIALDSTGGVHCVFERSDEIYYTKLSSAGIVEVQPTAVSSSGDVARNPDIAINDDDDVLVVWEDNDGVTGNYEIFRATLNSDGTVVNAAASILSDLTFDYKDPSLSANANGFNACYVLNDSTCNYSMIQGASFSTVAVETTVCDSTDVLYTPKIGTNNSYSYIVVNDNLTSLLVSKVDALGSIIWQGVEASDGSSSNILPSISADSTGNCYVVWDYANTYVKLTKIDPDGSVVTSASQTTAMDFEGYTRAPRVSVDVSDMVHIVAIEDIENSGDVHYKKYKYDLTVLLEDTLVQDQYNNANYCAMAVDSNRRPHIVWDSFDRRASNVYYCKRQKNDYTIIVHDSNYRYSTSEVLNILVDPYYGSDYIRWSYKYPYYIDSIKNFVESDESLDRVVSASYLVRNPVPCFVDVSMSYTGNDSSAESYITNYINDSTDYTLAVSDMLSSIPLSVASRVTLPVTINCERHGIDGEIVVTSSQDKITEPRSSRFIARNITIS